MSKCDRRTFLKQGLAATTGISIMSGALFSKTLAWATEPAKSPLPRKPLGRTGHEVSILSLGGEATIERADRREQAARIINRALDLGVNYIDTAPRYGQGSSEINIGQVMKTRRKEVFLATKSHDYTYDGTMKLIEQSLDRLQTDYLDLYQHHFVRSSSQLRQLEQKNSARQAFERLKNEGVIRNIGITGHSSRLLAEALQNYDYDCVLITINAARASMNDSEYLDHFFALASEKNVGVIGMKVVNAGSLLRQGLTIRQLLPYTMSYPVATTVMGISEVAFLEEDVRIASSFEPLSPDEMAEIRTIAQAGA